MTHIHQNKVPAILFFSSYSCIGKKHFTVFIPIHYSRNCKRKARGEFSAFRIDGKKQGNRSGIDLGSNAMATVAGKNEFRPENGHSQKV
ncbi:hypothetical protein CEXT_267441 [Caerostris extrusa]|uniref:Transposase n=1 Tax=Caerostris extrusa TaxID=172846 RepID=A0AAV4QPE8_CAEEX|nr:hypothetical protein CEXT_267441 [Caerostris extrusa]